MMFVRVLILGLCFMSCKKMFINLETSHIGSLNLGCVRNGSWEVIREEFSQSKISDTLMKSKVDVMINQLWECDILYFNDPPQELVGVSKNHYTIRCLFNPNVSEDVLDGFSEELKREEKERVLERVRRVFVEYSCEY